MTNEVRPSENMKLVRWRAVIAASALFAAVGDAPGAGDQTRGGTLPAVPAAATSKGLLTLVKVAENPACWPKEVTLSSPVSFAVVYDGRVAGQTVVPVGSRVRLVRVLADQVEVENEGARQMIAADSSDVLVKATRIYNALPAWSTASVPTGQSASPGAPPAGAAPEKEAPGDYGARAREVAEEIQRDFWNPQTGLYSEKPGGKDPAVIWAGGVMFSALVGAARNDPGHYGPVMRKYFQALDAYWDRKQPLAGYEPLPGGGDGHDKYYDDNEWVAITFLEARELTGQPDYSRRAAETMKFVLSGWDETYLKGGIWWHEAHEKKNRQKNTCANAPAAVACLQLARVSQPPEAQRLIAMAHKIADWTVTNLQLPNKLFADTRDIEGDGMNRASLTYNSALMVRAFLGLYRVTGDQALLRNAQSIAVAADSLLDKKTGVYRDQKKWAHLMVEADLALYRTTREPYLLQRARRHADAYYKDWKANGPVDLIAAASIARVLWLMADTETAAGRDFWRKADAPGSGSTAAGLR